MSSAEKEQQRLLNKCPTALNDPLIDSPMDIISRDGYHIRDYRFRWPHTRTETLGDVFSLEDLETSYENYKTNWITCLEYVGVRDKIKKLKPKPTQIFSFSMPSFIGHPADEFRYSDFSFRLLAILECTLEILSKCPLVLR